MKNEFWVVLTITACLFMMPGPAAAHHAGANYDREHLISLSGVVTEFVFTNPHAEIIFDVKGADGSVVKWVGVMEPPQNLYKRGWNKTTLKAGDQITLTGGPRVDGSKELDIRNDQVFVNGKKLAQKE